MSATPSTLASTTPLMLSGSASHGGPSVDSMRPALLMSTCRRRPVSASRTPTASRKDFTESIILAEIVSTLLEDNGYTVERQFNLGGTAVVHQALISGEVDIYVEYTGTGLLAILGEDLPETSASPVAGASPAATDTTRLRPPSRAPTAPAAVSAREARIHFPPLP